MNGGSGKGLPAGAVAVLSVRDERDREFVQARGTSGASASRRSYRVRGRPPSAQTVDVDVRRGIRGTIGSISGFVICLTLLTERA
jgi:hypothetical protein